jgi:hypothetical protein
MRCAPDTAGLDEVAGFNNTHDVYEATPFSGTKHYDWKQARLEDMGVNVDDFHGVDEEHHKWDGAGKDTYEEPMPTNVEWHKLNSAQWAWNNHAMKSQGWDPEGKLNKDLMLGVTWNDTHPSPFATSFSDNFVTKKEYAKQLEPHHEQVRSE